MRRVPLPWFFSKNTFAWLRASVSADLPCPRRWGVAALVSLGLAFPAPAGAAGVSCHCFRDRDFNPQQPAASDPYVLATTQNSLLALAFGISKKQVVQDKMSGTSGSDLWVAHYVASATGKQAETLLQLRRKADTWAAVLTAQGLDPAALFHDSAPPSDDRLAAAAVDATLHQYLHADLTTVAALRQSGATDPEVIVAVYAARHSAQGALDLYRQVVSGTTTWSRLLHSAGITPPQIEDNLPSLH